MAFGVVPATMAYMWMLEGFGRLGLMAAFLFMACGALRLARFNVQAATSSKKHFVGLPIPAAACTLATLVLFTEYVPQAYMESVLPLTTLCLVYVLSFFMVSNHPFLFLQGNQRFQGPSLQLDGHGDPGLFPGRLPPEGAGLHHFPGLPHLRPRSTLFSYYPAEASDY